MINLFIISFNTYNYLEMLKHYINLIFLCHENNGYNGVSFLFCCCVPKLKRQMLRDAFILNKTEIVRFLLFTCH